MSYLLAFMGCMGELSDEGFSTSYVEYCASCHGESLEGSGIGPALVGRDLKHGETVEELKKTRRSPLMRMWDDQRNPQRFPERRP